MSFITRNKHNLASDSAVRRGGTAAALGSGGTAALTTIALAGIALRREQSGGAIVPTIIRATLTGALAFGGVGALTNVHLTHDRYKDTFVGAGIGTGIGFAGTAMVDMVWNSRNLTPKALVAHSLMGAAVGGAIYGTLALSGATQKEF
jgi:hypothetical protein